MNGAQNTAGLAARVLPHTVCTAMIMGLPFSIHLRGSLPDAGDRGGSTTVGARTAAVGAAGAYGADDSVGADRKVSSGMIDSAVIEEAVDAVWESLRRDELVFSTYRPDSDISRIRAGQLRIDDADPAVEQVLDLAEIARRLTGGAFDVNGGSSHTGHPYGRRTRRGSALDPSGIVKGWAASRAAVALDVLGVDYYLNAGGDVLLRSRAADRPWRIGIEHPDDPRGLIAVVEMPAGAVATSGRTHRGAHIWNPATGGPATGIAQATVVGPSLVWADVLATAVVAGGLERLDPAQWPPGHDVMLVTDDGASMASSGFPARLAPGVPAPRFSVIG